MTSTLTPGEPAVCLGRVWHARRRPVAHEFTTKTAMVWVDPDRLGELCASHPLWSTRRMTPVQLRAADYGDGSASPLGEGVRADLVPALGYRPVGEVRMLTQPRVWGWLFNPLTVHLAWHRDDTDPVGAVVEVTNTPWKERHRYAVALRPDGAALSASFAKELHVSPFLDEAFRYDLRIAGSDSELHLEITVARPGSTEAVLETALHLRRDPATRRQLSRFLVARPLSTHRVSAGIHFQAARLWAERVPFVAHPSRRSADVPEVPSS